MFGRTGGGGACGEVCSLRRGAAGRPERGGRGCLGGRGDKICEAKRSAAWYPGCFGRFSCRKQVFCAGRSPVVDLDLHRESKTRVPVAVWIVVFSGEREWDGEVNGTGADGRVWGSSPVLLWPRARGVPGPSRPQQAHLSVSRPGLPCPISHPSTTAPPHSLPPCLLEQNRHYSAWDVQ